MRLFVVLVLSLFMSVSPALADSFTSLQPLVPVSEGTTTAAVGGVTGSCFALRYLPTATNLLTLDCSGNLGVNSLGASGLTPGGCVQAGASGVLTTPSSAGCGGGGGSTSVKYPIQSGSSSSFGFNQISSSPATPGNVASSIGTSTVKTLEVACLPYNTSTPASLQPYTGPVITGGTVVFYDLAPGTAGLTTIGTLNFPNTTNGTGNDVVLTLATPYTPPANSIMTFAVTAIQSSSTNQWFYCSAYIGT